MKPMLKKEYKKELYINKLNFFSSTSNYKVAEVFFNYPEKEFSLSDLAKLSHVAKANIGKILSDFEKSDFIKIEKLSKIWRIKANIFSQDFIRAKIVYNLNSLYFSGTIDFLLDYFNNPKNIILFGSYRKGEDISTSDIDIAIQSELAEYKILFLKDLLNYEKKLKRKIQIHLYNKKVIDTNLLTNIANGIILYGFLEI